MKHWSEYPSQQPAHRRRVRKARELREGEREREVSAALAAIRQQAAENCGLAEYPADLIASKEIPYDWARWPSQQPDHRKRLRVARELRKETGNPR